MNLLTMCSSHRRYDMLTRMVNSWANTVQGADSKLVVYVDEKNPHIAKYKAIALPKNAVIEYGPYKTMVEVVNYFSCQKYRDCDFYSEANDDHVFVTPGWDVKMMEAINRKNMGVAIAYGRTQNLPTATMHGASIVRLLGYFFPPEYTHSWVDNWLIHIGNGSNILTFLPDVVIDHRHPAWGKAERDATYDAVDNNYYPGKCIFEKWVNDKRDIADIKKIRNLIESRCGMSGDVLAPIEDESISAMMTTFNRTELLEKTVKSYLKVRNRPPRLYVFDDCSSDFDEIKRIVSRIPEAVLIRSKKNLGCYQKGPAALKQMFLAGAKTVVVVDSDCLFSENWWSMANRIYENNGLCCLINLSVHPALTAPREGLVQKEHIGGLGMIITKDTWEKHLKDFNKPDSNWDCHLCYSYRGSGGKIYACSPSMLQHTGASEGTHPTAGVTADDFEGEPVLGEHEINFQRTSQEEIKRKILANLPPGFGPDHEKWNVPSFQQKWMIAHGAIFRDMPKEYL